MFITIIFSLALLSSLLLVTASITDLATEKDFHNERITLTIIVTSLWTVFYYLS